MENDESDAIDSLTPAGLPDAGGGTTCPLCAHGHSLDYPPGGVFGRKSAPPAGMVGLPVKALHVAYREAANSLRWTITLDWTTRAASSRPHP
jgi:hypothetical protein